MRCIEHHAARWIPAIAILGAAANGASVTLEFDEIVGQTPQGSILDGAGLYASQGLAFLNEVVWGSDTRFLSAGNDTYGLSNGATANMTLVFTTAVVEATFYWLSVNSADVYATAFDADGAQIGAFSSTGNAFPFEGGVHTFSGIGEIASITLHDGGGFIGVGRLEYTQVGTIVPLPGPFGLGVAGLAGLMAVRRRR